MATVTASAPRKANAKKPVVINNSRMVVTYIRVSTERQGVSGLGLDAQYDALREEIARNNLEEIGGFVEVESGKKASNRPELTKAIEMARFNKCTLLIAKLDRLARNVHFITGLIETGVKFRALDCPFEDISMVQMYAVFAEMEARRISERTKAALAVLKSRGKKLGGYRPIPLGTIERNREKKNKQYRGAEQAEAATIELFRELIAKGITMPRVVCRVIRRKKLKRASGAPWYPKYVIPFIRRHQLMPINEIAKLQKESNLTELIRKERWSIRQDELAEQKRKKQDADDTQTDGVDAASAACTTR